jgi:hypothetical protein
MATPRLQISDLDFDQIKTNLKSYLKQQSQFQDYDFEGAGLNILLDILAYNTHYNAYYLNMVANESFLDTALLRDSVVSHAKTLGYTPYSVTAPLAKVNITVESGDTTPGTLTIPKGFAFNSNLIDNISYNFVTLDGLTVTKANTTYFFENVDIYEGSLNSYNFTYVENSNPKSIFVLPDSNLDTSTISVSVSPSAGNTFSEVYTQVTDVLDITSESLCFFLQESKNGNYQIYFGDGVIGKKLTDGAIVTVNYLITNGENANAADGFSPNATIGGFSNITVDIVGVAAGGSNRETVDSIKYSAQAQYATQNRLVTVKDYESYIKSNYPSIDAISVWGGEDETPKVFGRVFISLKPKANYFLSETEKQRIIDEVINPKAIVSVAAEIREPEYLYLLANSKVQYDPKKTTLDEETIKAQLKQSIISYKNTNLNKFGAYFVLSDFQDYAISIVSSSILGSESVVRVQKRFAPKINEVASYLLRFSVPLRRGTSTNKLLSTEFSVFDSTGIIRRAVFEESPQSFTGVSQIQITAPGSGYTTSPTVTISGDGSNATAEAVVVNGRIQSIRITNRGTDYTRAIVTITDETGYGADAVAVIDGKTGTLRTIYYDSLAQRQIINSNAGEIDYDNGIITINSINFLLVNADDGLIRIDIEAERGIIQSLRNSIITIDETDPAAIVNTLEKISI